MAMIDIGAVLAQQVRANSGEARIEGHVVIAAFAERIDGVSQGGVKTFIENELATTKAVAANEMTKESAAIIMHASKLLMDAKVGYAVAYFKPR